VTLRHTTKNEDLSIHLEEENIIDKTEVHGRNMYQEPLHTDSHDGFRFVNLQVSETWDLYRHGEGISGIGHNGVDLVMKKKKQLK
jgi:hypothetical protein